VPDITTSKTYKITLTVTDNEESTGKDSATIGIFHLFLKVVDTLRLNNILAIRCHHRMKRLNLNL